MLVAVTTRGELREVLRSACVATPLHGARAVTFEFVSTLADAMVFNLQASVLVLDLATILGEAALLTYLHAWRNLNPACAFVLVRSLTDKTEETKLVMEMLVAAGTIKHDVLFSLAQAHSVTTWIDLLLSQPEHRVLLDVKEEFEHVLPATVPNRSLLMQMLGTLSTATRVKDVAGKYAGHGIANASSTQRGRMNRLLKAADQPVTKEILTAFRLLLHAKLLDLAKTDPKYWRPNRRATILGAGNHRALKRSLTRCVGFPYETVCAISYEDAQTICAGLLVPEPGGATRTVHEMVGVVLGTPK